MCQDLVRSKFVIGFKTRGRRKRHNLSQDMFESFSIIAKQLCPIRVGKPLVSMK